MPPLTISQLKVSFRGPAPQVLYCRGRPPTDPGLKRPSVTHAHRDHLAACNGVIMGEYYLATVRISEPACPYDGYGWGERQ